MPWHGWLVFNAREVQFAGWGIDTACLGLRCVRAFVYEGRARHWGKCTEDCFLVAFCGLRHCKHPLAYSMITPTMTQNDIRSAVCSLFDFDCMAGQHTYECRQVGQYTCDGRADWMSHNNVPVLCRGTWWMHDCWQWEGRQGVIHVPGIVCTGCTQLGGNSIR